MLYAKEASSLGVRWPRGVLLHGPSGTGKSAAVAAVAAEFGAPIHVITAGSVIGSFVGESERRLREAFAAADADAATTGRPVVIFLDDVDTLCPRRGPGQQHEARLVGQILTLLDGAASGAARAPATAAETQKNGHVVVVAATSRPNAIDPALRRPGRLDREVAVGVPSPDARFQILTALASRLPINPEKTDLQTVAARCHGYTGADLEALCREAATAAIAEAVLAEHTAAAAAAVADNNNININESSTFQPRLLTTEDFLAAMRRVGASVARSVVRELPPASWSDIGGLEPVKARLRQAVEWPITRAAAFKRLGILPPRGVLLHGPPGCAKTTLARAAATASGATFIPLQGASLYSMYVGEGEAELRDAFRRARLAAPAIVFIDELDMLVGKRGAGAGGTGTDDASARLLSTFLNEMDGLEAAGAVTVLATTNRPEAVDIALLRPGRFDVTLYVPPPDVEGRLEALKVHTRGMALGGDVDLERVAEATERYTGAELAAVCREAAMAALREDVVGAVAVAGRHFDAAVAGVVPALATDVLERYEAWPPRKSRVVGGH